ncbi:MAG TPA: acyl-CoA dehydrogenase family protein, partial [Acidimicrobiales bacterium]|nr:acyl-CoA dehydrogenase family protein [Acidimicrobiales bacterium]
WPRAFGGRDATLWEWLIFEEEYYRAGAPQRVTQNGIFLLAPTVFEFGTAVQQAAILPRMAAAEDLWCQGWSEPGAGSDLAAISSRAERVEGGREAGPADTGTRVWGAGTQKRVPPGAGAPATAGGWRLNGQKTWTTRGAFCTHLFGLFRTDPGSERHRGLTYLLVPLSLEGVTVRGFGRLDGDEGFAEVFFDDVFLPDESPFGSWVLGEPGNGWAVAMATTGSERGLTLRSPGRFTATAGRLIEAWRASGCTDTALCDRITRAVIRAEAYRLFTLQTVTRIVESGGRDGPGAESSINKIWWSDLDVELHSCALDLLGPAAELEGPWSKAWQFSLAGPIYAGTNEIQRDIAAERLLGLPRSRR